MGLAHIHSDGQQAQTSVVRDEWLVLFESMILDETCSHGKHKIPVEEGAKELSANIAHIKLESRRSILDEHNQDL